MHVVVIGAGTGGLCLAHGLKRAGVSVGVYERHADRTDGSYGYRVGIDPTGTAALRACLPPDLFATFAATCARGPRRINVLTEKFGVTASFPFEPAEGEYSVSRRTLRQVLLTGLEDNVHYGKVFDRYEQHGDKVTAYFQDGTSTTGDVLVAADGTNSRIRRQYLPQAVVADSGVRAVSGTIPLTSEVRALLPPELLDGISMTFASKGQFCIWHVMELRWDREGAPKLGVPDDDAALLTRWPGLRHDGTRDCVTWEFSATADAFPETLREMRGEELVRLVLDLTPHWHPDFRQLFELTDPGGVVPFEDRTSEPIPPWEATNVTLLGDAVHTMPLGRGPGGNTALRDAALLSRRLAGAARGEGTLLGSVASYEAEMTGYAFARIADTLGQHGTGPDRALCKPHAGRFALALTRAFFRTASTVPPLRRRLVADLHGHGSDTAVEPLPH
ncbi:FAD-dependent oxidoreductase [Actinomadura roseirufa]|uniref:FAD-dependent oxidoreductase n=1 Tax=Actinomadura roseirufa TaxID=2094049 RepID=UPI0010413EF9|nr:NAD(P)/FAD-dependent oxidoreductase [Actinomadura roseirufa]